MPQFAYKARDIEGNLVKGAVGAPERGDFGYLGDMGRLPTALTEF